MEIEPIGVVRSSYHDPSDVPCCQRERLEAEAVVEVLPEHGAGLQDLDGFSHIILVSYLHRAKVVMHRVTPPIDDQVRGVFATRSPNRPNHLGVSVAELIGIEGLKVTVRGVDLVDGTPVLDIKPYTPYDSRKPVRLGWLEGKVPPTHPSDTRGR